MEFDHFEKKIMIGGLGFITLLFIFFIIHKKSKILEGTTNVVGTAVSIPGINMPDILPSSIMDTVVSIGQSASGVATTQGGAIQNTIVTTAQGTIGTQMTLAMKILASLEAAAKFASSKATAVAGSAKSAIRAEVISLKQKMSDRVRTIKQNIQIEAQRLKAEFKEKIKSKMTFMRFFKYIAILSLFFSKIGKWAVKTTSILLIRISNFKSCFIWYALEIIGWILYLPMEFFVWFFCLQSMEKDFWGMIKEIDCFVNSVIGFHIFYYSDYIRKKCFYPRLPPFPPIGLGGKLTVSSLGNVMKEIFMPVDPADMAKYVRSGLAEYKEKLMESFKKPPNFDVNQIWEEALSTIEFLDVTKINKDGPDVPDTSDEELADE